MHEAKMRGNSVGYWPAGRNLALVYYRSKYAGLMLKLIDGHLSSVKDTI
jgi:hypothetical protein